MVGGQLVQEPVLLGGQVAVPLGVSQAPVGIRDARDGAALVEVATARYELSLPPKLTYGQIKGFTLYATRTILSGGGEELVELTKTNLRELEAE